MSQTQSFSVNGSFTVPANVTSLTLTAVGGGGGGYQVPFGTRTTDGGGGGIVTANISVTPGDVLEIYIGGGGGTSGIGGSNGYAGTGNGGNGVGNAAGGAATCILNTTADAMLLVAGGGGGGGLPGGTNGTGGWGGGDGNGNGQDGLGGGGGEGGGAMGFTGGTGGNDEVTSAGSNGSADGLFLGNGGSPLAGIGPQGAGGGGGWGGGGGGNYNGSGGGGSSYITSSANSPSYDWVTAVGGTTAGAGGTGNTTTATNGNAGLVTISYTPGGGGGGGGMVSNICFPAGTPITTDQGIVAIDKINIKYHTIGKLPVKHITQTVSRDNYLIYFPTHALAKNMPNQPTIMTKDHLIAYNGRLLPAEHFLTMSAGVKKVKYSGELLYNVLLNTYSTMVVNNLICETLHPENNVAQLYLNNFSEASKKNVIAKLNNTPVNNFSSKMCQLHL